MTNFLVRRKRRSSKMKPNPSGEERNPFQVYMLVLAIVSGISSLVRDTPSTSGTVAYYLDGWTLLVWSLMLSLSAFAVLLGMFWPGQVRDGLLLKRIGFLGLIIPTTTYAIVLGAVHGVEALTLSLTMLAFSLACVIQFVRVDRKVRKSVVIQEYLEERQGERELGEDEL